MTSIAPVKLSNRAVPEVTSSWCWALATGGWKSVGAWRRSRVSSRCWKIRATWDVSPRCWTSSADNARAGRTVRYASMIKTSTTSNRAMPTSKCTWKPLTCASVVCSFFVLLHCTLASCGAVYCNRSCLWVCLFVCVCLWVCYRDNSKLRASILTKLGMWVKVVTISSWLNFGRPAPSGRRSAAGRKFLAPPYYSQRAVFASVWELLS